MFQERLFQPKYFIGWIPSAYVLSAMLAGKEALFMTFVLCLIALLSLGIITAVMRVRGKSPINWAIVWWCYPAVWLLNFIWQAMRVPFR